MKKLICIVCPRGCEMEIEMNEEEYIINGNQCKRGKIYAIDEMTEPHRSFTTTVRTKYVNVPRLPVRSDKEVDAKIVLSLMRELDSIELDHPVHIGETIAGNILDTGVNIIATADLYELLGIV